MAAVMPNDKRRPWSGRRSRTALVNHETGSDKIIVSRFVFNTVESAALLLLECGDARWH
jgi:hypothetical protein